MKTITTTRKASNEPTQIAHVFNGEVSPLSLLFYLKFGEKTKPPKKTHFPPPPFHVGVLFFSFFLFFFFCKRQFFFFSLQIIIIIINKKHNFSSYILRSKSIWSLYLTSMFDEEIARCCCYTRRRRFEAGSMLVKLETRRSVSSGLGSNGSSFLWSLWPRVELYGGSRFRIMFGQLGLWSIWVCRRGFWDQFETLTLGILFDISRIILNLGLANSISVFFQARILGLDTTWPILI